MKAYKVTNPDGRVDIVFAETSGKAKQETLGKDGFDFDKYTDLRATRLKIIDGMEKEEPCDNLWLNEKIRAILVKHGWYCDEPNVYERCDDCYCKAYCELYQSRLEETNE